MAHRTGNQIREEFLRFFETKGHRRVHSSSLVPANDPTLLFTNAGMNQFKDVFLGAEHRDYRRATTSQKCVRAGGKHNDLENVGFTRRHHTFFEMLGNFSFGDYFKREAIAFAWELITSPEWYGIPKDRLYVTIFEGTKDVPRDEEARKFWMEAGVAPERIRAYGMKDNFWQMGETGPCGPCSEIFFDLGVEASESGEDKPFGHDDQRYIEIWNLVFMQFDRAADGKLTALPKPSIDTGMGLERIAAVLQGKLSNYETDLFTPLIARAAELTGKPLTAGEVAQAAISDERSAASLRIIADHARAATFLIHDGVLPANDGRGYVLRKIMRRGIRHGRLLGQERPFLHEMVLAVCEQMNAAYPELGENAERIAKVVLAEEQQFARTLQLGLTQMNEEALTNGAAAFRLYETYGMPLDFMVDAARDAGLTFDMAGFDAAKEAEQARARASWKGGSQKSAAPVYRDLPATEFEGYLTLRVDGANVLAIVKDGVGVPSVAAGDEAEIVLDGTSFYADSGGQVGDTGWLYSADHNTVVADVKGCTKPVQGVFAHKVVARRAIATGDMVDTVVDAESRNATRRNHTGTHLLHAALRQVLGKHVKQAGSLVTPGRLRFDFSHFAAVADEELAEIESIVNREVLANTAVETLVDVPIDVAVNDYGAMALFGEKYGDRVRVVKIGEFSTELCGGTHTAATGEIGLIKLVGEGSVSSGVRRVEAVSGTGSLVEFRRGFEAARLATRLTGHAVTNPAEALEARFAAQDEEIKRLKRDLDTARMKTAAASTSDAAGAAVDVKGVKVLAQRVDGLDKTQMRSLVDTLRGKLGTGVVVLGAVAEGKAALIVGVTKELSARVHAGKLVGQLAAKVGGRGGGRPDLAEAGGPDAGALDAALAAASAEVAALLG